MDLIIIIISIIVFIVNLIRIITFNKNVDMIINTIAVIISLLFLLSFTLVRKVSKGILTEIRA